MAPRWPEEGPIWPRGGPETAPNGPKNDERGIEECFEDVEKGNVEEVHSDVEGLSLNSRKEPTAQ